MLNADYWIVLLWHFLMTIPELEGDGAIDVVEMNVVGFSIFYHLFHSTVYTIHNNTKKSAVAFS